MAGAGDAEAAVRTWFAKGLDGVHAGEFFRLHGLYCGAFLQLPQSGVRRGSPAVPGRARPAIGHGPPAAEQGTVHFRGMGGVLPEEVPILKGEEPQIRL